MNAPTAVATARLLVLIVLLLAVARALGAVTERLGLTRVVGELATGFVLGPSLFGRVAPGAFDLLAPAVAAPLLTDLALLGLVFLLTLAGLETDVALIRSYATDVVVVGSAGLVAPFALGLVLGLVIPGSLLVAGSSRLVFALFLATSLCISAIPVIVRILVDLDLFAAPFGQRTVATAMYTDVVGWLLLSVVVGLARTGRLDPRAVGTVVAALVAVVVTAVTVGQRLVDGLLARLGPDAIRGHLAVVVGAAALGSALTYAVGVEPAIGAFVVGLLLARSDAVSEPAVERFERLTLGLFAPVFFGVAGLNADLGLLFDPVVAAVGVATVALATVGKVGGAALAASWLGRPRAEALGAGVALNARGAVEIVVATLGLELGILGVRMYTVVLVVAVVTSAVTAPLIRRTVAGPRPPQAAGGG